MAQRVRALEKKYDSSMRGVYLDSLVTEYVQLEAGKTVEMFDYIMKNQKETRETYGDIDEAVTKLKTRGSLDRYNHKSILKSRFEIDTLLSKMEGIELTQKSQEEKPSVEYQAMLLEDIFCGMDFLLIKITHTNYSPLGPKLEFHIRRVHKKLKNAELSLVRYGDIRDSGYALSLQSDYGRPYSIEGGSGMLSHYSDFNGAYRTLLNVYNELKENG